MDRHDISRLEKNRSIHFKLGFVIAISLITLAFNYTIEPPEPYKATPIEIITNDAVPVVRTVQKPKQVLPPPSLKVTDQIISKEVEFTETLEPNTVALTIDAKPVEVTMPEPTIIKKPSPPAPEFIPPDPVESEPEIFEVVEHMPLFGDCDGEGMSKEEKRQCSTVALLKFMGEHIKYPAIARENNIQGTVVVRFIVDEFGRISKPKIVKDIGGGCGKEALRVVKKMPIWEPGRQRERTVKVYFNLPVQFRLN